MIKKVIYQLLSNTANVTDRLAVYEGGPAIFTIETLPDNCPFPAIWLSLVGGTPFDTRGNRGADWHLDIEVYDDKDLSSSALDDLAMAIWDACDRADLSALLDTEGYMDAGCRASPPSKHGGPDSFPGYLIRVQARTLKKDGA